MQSVDHSINITLQEYGCPINTAITDLSVEEAFKVTNFTISLIQYSHQEDLSQSLEARYQQASRLVDSIKDLGFRGDIGFETFLYGNTLHLRNVLLFLLQKIQRAKSPVSVPTTRLTCFMGQVKDALREQFLLSFLPRQLMIDYRSFSEGHPCSFILEGLSEIRPILCTSRFDGAVCSLLANFTRSRLPRLKEPSIFNNVLNSKPPHIDKTVEENQETLGSANRIAQKTNLAFETSGDIYATEITELVENRQKVEFPVEEDVESLEELEEILEIRSMELTDLEKVIELLEMTKKDINNELEKVKTEYTTCAGTLEAISTMDLDTKELENCNAVMQKRRIRLENMEVEWSLHLEMLTEETIKASELLKEETDSLVQLKTEIERLTKVKNETQVRHQSMLNQPISAPIRHVYIDKIFYTQKCLNDQRQEYSILSRTCKEQEDHIFLVKGTMERTFDELVELFDKDPRRLNKIIPQAKERMTEIHELCERSREITEKRKEVTDSLNTIDDKIAQLEIKNTASKIENIMKDLKIVHNQNKQLSARLGQ